MKFGGTNISSLDFPGHISLVIFTGGCPLRCPYCHNPEIILGEDEISLKEIFQQIDNAAEFVDSIVVTGGEPLMQHAEVIKILEYAKSKSLETKLDTNGCYPEKLKKAIDLVDYVGLDIKAPFDRYLEVIGLDIGEKVEKTMNIALKTPHTFLECKTTYVPGLVTPHDVKQISREIDCDLYTLQQFRNRVVLDPALEDTPSPLPAELKKLAEMVKPILKRVRIKTAEFGEQDI